MKNRIFKNWQSSIVGVVLLLCSGALFYIGKITWQEFVAFLPFCLTWIYVQNSIFKINV